MKLTNFLLVFFLASFAVQSKAETFAVGSYIINMGVVPQTVGNGMKPYGLVYEFLKTYNIPVKWVIGSSKIKDSADFTYSSKKYKGGTFIIPKQYINATIKSRLTYWKGQGVVMDSTTSSLTLNVTRTLTSAPKWTISTVNTSIVTAMFTYAGIPSSAYNTIAPASLGTCDDIFAMPHADPTWALHGNLYNWNRTNKGAIWANCHAISVLESLVNPLNSSEQMNFLSTKGLINYGSHADGTPAYSYFFNRASYNGAPISARADDPVFQMMGIEDGAHTNGSEQIYIPISGSGSGWRNTTKIGCYDSTQSNVSAFPNGPAAVSLYGRGFGLNSAGYVMYQSGHNVTGTGTANVATMRQFFNFSFMAVEDKVPNITASSINTTVGPNYTYTFSVSANSPVGASLSYQWSTTGGGTFSTPTAATTSFTTSSVNADSSYVVSCVVTDACGRSKFISTAVTTLVALPIKLIDFEATLQEQLIHISWLAAEDNEVSHYELLRSFDGLQFQSIAKIEATGGIQFNQYTYSDQDFVLNNNRIIHYQLKIVDRIGNSQMGPIQVIENSQYIGKLSLFPNPVSNLLNIQFEGSFSQQENLEITDIYGRLVQSNAQLELIDEHTINYDASDLTKGVYYIHLRMKKGGYAIAKFVKI